MSLLLAGHGVRSCSDVGTSAIVASETRVVVSSGTAWTGRRRRRVKLLISSYVLERLAIVALRMRVVDASGTVHDRKRQRTVRIVSSDVSRRRCRRVGDAIGRGIVRDSLQSTTSASRAFLLIYWYVTLSSHRGCSCGFVRDILQSTSSAGREARSACGVETPVAISSGTCHSRRPRWARQLASFVASGTAYRR